MGVRQDITHSTFPPQSDWVGKEVEVCFHYDTKNIVSGKIVREDKTSPVMIIQLEDGRFVLATECQYSLKIRE